MLWKGRRQSTNVEDRRGAGGRIPGGRATMGIGTIILVLIVSYVTGISPSSLLQVAQQAQPAPAEQQLPAPGAPPAADEASQFIRVVLASTEDAWTALFTQKGWTYEPPTLVLFSGGTPSGCGYGDAATGPFYCPADRRVYIDLSFYDELRDRFGAPGDTAQAYVIAHEVGHHVQQLLGASDDVRQAQQRASREEANELSVRLELQADCYAGAWANHAETRFKMLEPGDLEEALGAAAAIGDDRIQRDAGRRVQPESWTHGSSEMRVRWFRKGFETGDPAACDTFNAASL